MSLLGRCLRQPESAARRLLATSMLDDLRETVSSMPLRWIQLVVVLVIFGYTYMSPAPIGRQSVPLGDAELHMIGSAVLFLSVFGATHSHLRISSILLLIGIISFCPEYAQSLFSARIFEWSDVGMNSLGSCLGAAISWVCCRIGWANPQ